MSIPIGEIYFTLPIAKASITHAQWHDSNGIYRGTKMSNTGKGAWTMTDEDFEARRARRSAALYDAAKAYAESKRRDLVIDHMSHDPVQRGVEELMMAFVAGFAADVRP